MKVLFFLALLVPLALCAQLGVEDIRFCVEREHWDLLGQHLNDVEVLRTSHPGLYYDAMYGVLMTREDTLAWHDVLYDIALERECLETAWSWLETLPDSQSVLQQTQIMRLRAEAFTSPADTECFDYMVNWRGFYENEREMVQDSLLHRYGEANVLLQGWLREKIDAIAVERSDSLRLAGIEAVMCLVPDCSWQPVLWHLKLRALEALGRWSEVQATLVHRVQMQPGPVESYFLVAHLLDTTVQDSLGSADVLQQQADALLFRLQTELDAMPPGDSLQVLYDTWSVHAMRQKACLMHARLLHTQMAGIDTTSTAWRERHDRATELLRGIEWPHNDTGDVAELWYWRGRVGERSPDEAERLDAATALVRCLVAGSPRNRYDEPALEHLTTLAGQLAPGRNVMDWARELVDYTGPVFEDVTAAAGLSGHESRVAWGDMDSDGDADLLLNGRRLLRNDGGRFHDVSDDFGFYPAGASGGLWADVNGDGRLDIVSLSHRSEGAGDGVWLRQNGDFVLAAYSIDDSLPTEGAAVFDVDRDGYPELYCASYEIPGEYTGNPDQLWLNNGWQLRAAPRMLRLFNPWDTPEAAQAGRGVAPADYDNDGDTELYVCNYRLDRNFLLDPVFDATGQHWHLQDTAAAQRLQGHEESGCYGHSIGADWGDMDNDGDLDLFVANLAHPRYIAFSNKSMLLRNDGPAARMIGDTLVEFTAFTNVTAEAGITYDETHSDPSWLDADNDGDLDLFITSIYTNERSYLYRNNGDGTFTDVTWLAGARLYNGWGNAVADYNHDGLQDIAVGSGSGMRLLANRTPNSGWVVRLRPVWNVAGKPVLLPADTTHVQTRPLLGARVQLDTLAPDGRRVTRIREVQGGKGTTSQHEAVAHFGIGNEKPLRARLLRGNEVVDEWNP